MAQRRLVYPNTMLQKTEQINRRQTTFNGMNADDPASEIGADELADVQNLICFGKYMRSRSGSAATGKSLPRLDSSTTYSIKKLDDKIHVFDTTGLVKGNFLYSPEAEEAFQIGDLTASEFTPDYTYYFTTYREDIDGFVDTASYQIPCPYGWIVNSKAGYVLLHAGSELYTIDTGLSGNWTRIVLVGDGTVLGRSKSSFEIENDDVIVLNESGIFRVVFTNGSGYYLQINNGQPETRLFEQTRNVRVKKYGRNRIYSLSRIVGSDCLLGKRTTTGCELQAESAPVKLDSNRKDASKAYYDKPVGDGLTTYQRLVSGTDSSGNFSDISLWQAKTSHGFAITINGVVGEFLRDFSDVQSLSDAAATIQTAIRDFAPYARCEYDGELGKMFIYPGDEDGGTVSYLTAPSSGGALTADVLLNMTAPDSDPPYGYIEDYNPDSPALVTGMVNNDHKWTHYSIYGSANIGSEGVGNSEDQLVWLDDVPVIKVVKAAILYGIVTPSDVTKDWFVAADVGSQLLSTGGISDTIAYLCDSSGNEVNASSSIYCRLTNSSYQGEYLACGYGAQHYASKLTQSSGVVTIAAITGDTGTLPVFESTDVGKILFLSNGNIRHITGFISTTQVNVLESASSYDISGNGVAAAWEYADATDVDTIATTITTEQIIKSVTIDNVTESGYSWIDPQSTPILSTDFVATDIGRKIRIGDEEQTIRDVSSGKAKTVAFSYTTGTWDCEFVRPRSYIEKGSGTFASTDTGKQIIINDGNGGQDYRRVILAVDSDGNAWIDEFPFEGAWTVEITNAVVRSFNDTIKDETIINFANDPAFSLQTRFFQALPSSSVGALSPGFLFVADAGKIYYSYFTNTRRFILGWHRLDYQADTTLNDTIMAMKAYPNRMVAFGKNATYASNVGAYNSITTEKIGEVVFTVPQFSLVDKKGVLHTGAIEDVLVGQSVVMTKDGGVYLFDGKQFSQDLAAKKINTLLRKLGLVVTSNYDSVGGYQIFGSEDALEYTDECKIDATNGKCYRLAIMPNQGYGWVKFGGEGMVFPFPNLRGIALDEESGLSRQIIADSRTGKLYEVSTYDNTAGDKEESELDKGEYAIQSSFKLAEATGALESFSIEHLETHTYIRPLKEEEGGTYATGFQIDTRIFKDGVITPAARTKNTPINGDIVFDRKFQGHRLQIEIGFTAGSVKVVATDTFYLTKDTAGATAFSGRSTSESNHQQDYANGVLWFTRGSKPLLNRATGQLLTGTYDSRTEGMDGISNSAIVFTGAESLEATSVGSLSGDFTIQLGAGFTAATIPSVSEDEVVALDGSEFEDMDVVGNDNTFIALDRAKGRFVFVCNMIECGYLGKTGGWVTEEPAESAAENMGIYFDIDRSLFIFIIDGALVGLVDCNVDTGAFKTEIPASYEANIGAYIHCDIETSKISFIAQTASEVALATKGYVDEGGFN